MAYLKRIEYKPHFDCSITYDIQKDSFLVGRGVYVRREVAASEKHWRSVIIRQRPDYEELLNEAAGRIADMKFLNEQAIGASPNKTVVQIACRPKDSRAPTLNYDDNLEWYGEFKRTNYEQENIEFYTQKDLV